ncbi:YceD family protein [Okibacterium endophyticum]
MTDYRKMPFSVSVRDLVRRPGEMREHEYTVPSPATLGEGLVAVKEGTPIHEDVRFESVHEGILVTAEIETTAEGQCGRCLTEMTLPVEVEFQELFAYPSDESSEHEVRGDHVDLEPLVRDAVVLSLPFQPVCRPDCPGLDPETGERLAEQPDREPHETHDPRWSALANFRADTGSDASDAEASETTDREKR